MIFINMPMPSCCEQCRFLIEVDIPDKLTHDYYCAAQEKYIAYDTDAENLIRRHKDCTLKETINYR